VATPRPAVVTLDPQKNILRKRNTKGKNLNTRKHYAVVKHCFRKMEHKRPEKERRGRKTKELKVLRDSGGMRDCENNTGEGETSVGIERTGGKG